MKRGLARVVVGLLVLWTVGGRVEAQVPQAGERVMEITVIHRLSEEALAGVVLTARYEGRRMDQYVTDEQGRCRIPLVGGENLRYLTVSAKTEGFVPVQASWQTAEGKPIPGTFTMYLEPSSSIGGIIQDEQGNPIEGATVHVMVPSESPEQVQRVALSDHPVRTGKDGTWRCDLVPGRLKDVWLRLEHPDFISDGTYGATTKPPMEELRKLTGVMVMKKGVELAGVVLDRDGKPIAGASVAQGADRWGSNDPATRTDEKGGFRFANVRPGVVVLTVQAKGFAPDLQQLNVAKDMKPVEYRLERAKAISGRVVDSQGNPVAGAFVTADTWRGNRSIQWRVNTDEAGRFKWTDAPADEVLFDIGKQGYQYLRRFAMTTSETEYTITLRAPVRISGSVVDAQTNRPIEKFRVVPGRSYGPDQPNYFETRSARTGSAGKYEIRFTEPSPGGVVVRIEAEGYRPAVSPVYKSDGGDQVFEAKMKKGTEVAGRALLPDGAPAAGAEVVLCTASAGAYIRNGVNEPRTGNAPTVQTDAEGRFSFPPQGDAYLIAVIHEQGYGQVRQEQFEQAAEVKLEAWGRIEGRVMIGSKPGAGVGTALNINEPYERNRPRLTFHYEGQADNEGRFVFERVRPGEVQAARTITLDRGRFRTVSYSHGTPVMVRPGQTAQVTLGGTGRPVVGRVVMPSEGAPESGWTFERGNLSLTEPEIRYPDDWDDMTAEQRQAWFQQYVKTEEYKATQRSRRYYPLMVEADGTFRVEDVPSGSYTLSIAAVRSPMGNTPFGGRNEPVGSAVVEVVIPEMPGGRSDEPLDLGTRTMRVIRRAKVGEPAPLFEVKTLDGKPLRLADYKGKYVLVVFWYPGQPQIEVEMAKLKPIYAALQQESRFAMIGVSLETRAKTTQRFVQKNELKWVQGYLQDWTTAGAVSDYEMQQMPSLWLIGPDGKVLEKQPAIETLRATVGKALEGK